VGKLMSIMRPAYLLVAGFIMLGVCMLSAVWISLLEQRSTSWIQHTLEVDNRISEFGMMVSRAVSRQRGYLLTDQQSYLDDYHSIAAALPADLTDLRNATRDNPQQQRNIAQLETVTRYRLSQLDETIRLHQAGRHDEALAITATMRGQAATTGVEQLLTRMHDEEEHLLAGRRETATARERLALATLLISGALVAGLAIVSRLQQLRHIDDLEERNRKLAEEIAARTQAQSQVRQLQKMEAVGQLTGGIAHDFNNMLAIIVGSLDLARRRLAREDLGGVGKSIDHAQEGAQRAAALTAQLLAFSRSQALAPRVLEPNRLVAAMSELLRRTLGEPIEIETVLAGGLWRVCADASQIENTLVNLALNARDAMPDGGKLTIETANSELDDRYARMHEEVAAGQYVMISVTDTGHGMPLDVIERAFEPFFTTKEVGKGTGLGLSQVFGFVKQSAGHIKIYSELGKGTTIKVYLPRYVGEGETSATAASGADMPRGREDDLILVVEDDAQVRSMSVGMLQDLGYAVLEAGNGKDALALLAQNEAIRLLFTDVVMPGLTGRALADEARASAPDIKVLYTTGYTRNSIVHNGVVDHDVSLIQKPFSIGELARKIRAMLDSD